MVLASGDDIKSAAEQIAELSRSAPNLKLSREAFLRAYVGDLEMKVIPWQELWTLLRNAKMRGHASMIESFYDALFREARFDDAGVWTPAAKQPL